MPSNDRDPRLDPKPGDVLLLRDAELAELRRLYAAAEAEIGTQRDLAVAMNNIYLAFPGLIARLEAAQRLREGGE